MALQGIERESLPSREREKWWKKDIDKIKTDTELLNAMQSLSEKKKNKWNLDFIFEYSLKPFYPG